MQYLCRYTYEHFLSETSRETCVCEALYTCPLSRIPSRIPVLMHVREDTTKYHMYTTRSSDKYEVKRRGGGTARSFVRMTHHGSSLEEIAEVMQRGKDVREVSRKRYVTEVQYESTWRRSHQSFLTEVSLAMRRARHSDAHVSAHGNEVSCTSLL